MFVPEMHLCVPQHLCAFTSTYSTNVSVSMDMWLSFFRVCARVSMCVCLPGTFVYICIQM